ncbi:carboxypeptidase-like regulatory domain-containing protein [uncultured Fibrella sp.]|uniref:carboxypeptidase-like regulatory domain-containing protein n=1 Tax=uncultured Fibrella sp. TaxID=1284596 RepID=UPI0035CA3895
MGTSPRVFLGYLVVALLVLGSINQMAWAQAVPRTTLTGRITNATDGKPLPFASVYLNGTTRGTTTAEDGQFRLTDVPYGAHELVASYTGFSAVKQAIRIADAKPAPVEIALFPMANLLTGVVVTAKKDKAWLRQVERFEQDMIGSSAFARQCRITNPEVLEFTESGGILSATAREALLIDNQALGYRLTYTLIGFRSQLKTGKIVFGGTTLFKELTPESPKQMKQWERNRQQAYQGSVRQLLATLAAGTHEQAGFLVYLTDPAHPLLTTPPPTLSEEMGRHLKPFDVRALIKPGTLAHERWLISNSPIEILYTRVPSPHSPYRDAQFAFSELVLPQQSLGFTVTGQITAPRGFEAVGFLSNDRLATALPDGWQKDSTSATQLATARLDSASNQAEKRLKAEVALDSLVQRWQRQPVGTTHTVFLQIDKPLYLTGDRLWLSGYVLNPQTQQCDTASVGQALNVELWSEKNVLVYHQWLRVEAGRTAGTFRLADTLATGTYWLRAYTETDRQRGKPAFERPLWVANSQTPIGDVQPVRGNSDLKAAVGVANEFVEEVIGAPYRTTVSLDSTHLTITLDARSKARLPTAYVFIEVRGTLVKTAYIPARGSLTTTSWSTRTWPTGMALISVMDSTGRVWTRRTIRLGGRTSPVTARVKRMRTTTDQPEQETLILALHDDTGRPVSAYVSVAVTDADLTPADSLVADLPSYLGSLDNRRGTYPATKPPLPDITLHGRVSTTEKQPVNVMLMVTDRQGVLTRATQTDESGHFQVSQLALADTAQLLVQVTNRRGKPINATVSFSQRVAWLGSLPFWPDAKPLFAQWRSLIEAARQRQLTEPALYRQNDARQLRELVVRTNRPVDDRPADIQLRSLHNQVDQTIILDRDTPPFENLYLLIRAKVPGIRVDEVLTGGRTAYSVSFPGASSIMNSAVAPVAGRGSPPPTPIYKPAIGMQNPLFLIDGFPIDDIDGTQLIAFSPSTIERIEVLKTGAVAAMYGTQASRGVIALYTKVTRETAKAKGLSRHTVAGYVPAPAFVTVAATTEAKPVIRDIVAWEPLATTDKLGDVSIPIILSRSTRMLRVTLQGVSSSGQAISSVQLVPVERLK